MYQGLARSQYSPNPHLETLDHKLKDWLRGEGFRVSWKPSSGSYYRLWAGRGSGDTLQMCLVNLSKAESRRALGQVTLNLAGEGWGEDQEVPFETAFWEHVNSLVQAILQRPVKPESLEL